MIKSDIKRIVLDNKKVSSLYQGANLIYEKENVITGYVNTDKYDLTINGKKTVVRREFTHKFKDEIISAYKLLGTDTYMLGNGIVSADLSKADFSSNVNLSSAFGNCDSLKEINVNIDTVNTEAMDYMFFNCFSLKTLDLSSFNTAKTKSMNRMFYYCGNLESIKINFDLQSIEEGGFNYMFTQCGHLKDVIGEIRNLKLSINLMHSPLTNESAMVFINGMANVETPQTITFSKTTFDTLSEEQIAMATSKGWNVKSA